MASCSFCFLLGWAFSSNHQSRPRLFHPCGKSNWSKLTHSQTHTHTHRIKFRYRVILNCTHNYLCAASISLLFSGVGSRWRQRESRSFSLEYKAALSAAVTWQVLLYSYETSQHRGLISQEKVFKCAATMSEIGRYYSQTWMELSDKSQSGSDLMQSLVFCIKKSQLKCMYCDHPKRLNKFATTVTKNCIINS